MEGRRDFEDRLSAALDQARVDGTLVAVIVGELIGLLVVNTRFGAEAGVSAVRDAATRLQEAVHGYADFVAQIGESEFAVLIGGVADESDAHRVVARIESSFREPFTIRGEPVELGLAMAVNLGPGRRRTDIDLLWRTAEESGQARSALFQRLVSDVRGAATNLDEVAQAFADEGVARFGLQACIFEVDGRSWHAPAELPDRPNDGERLLRTEGRVIGSLRWWGPMPEDTDAPGVEVLLGHVAAALDRAAAMDAVDLRARTDPLTGLLNREGLAHELAEIDAPFAIGMIDLDHFKQINDHHGHEVGDLVLADLAGLLARGRSGDLIARWGGEEIMLVMPATTVDGAVARLNRLLEEARSFVRIEEVGPITFSAGVTVSVPSEPFGTAVRRADEALYRAKRAGRARIEVG